MRRSLALVAVAALASLSGCSLFGGGACTMEAHYYTVTIDAGDAFGVEACTKGVCVRSLEVDGETDYNSEISLSVGRQKDGSFEVMKGFAPPQVLTVTALNEDGTLAGKPKTFELDWSSEPDECGWGPASTDPISL